MANSAVLVGMMGSGKTTVGRAAAERLGWRFLDSDRQVEERTGRTVEQIWREEGEAGFRYLETEALGQALASTEVAPAVVAAAGGVVLNPNNRVLLKAHPPVVWLRARPETLAMRVGTGIGRPLLAGDPAGALVRLSAERRPYYEEVADTVIDVDDLTPAEVVDRVVEAALAEVDRNAGATVLFDDEPLAPVVPPPPAADVAAWLGETDVEPGPEPGPEPSEPSLLFDDDHEAPAEPVGDADVAAEADVIRAPADGDDRLAPRPAAEPEPPAE